MPILPHPVAVERRADDRHRSVLAVGKVVVRARERFCLIRDVSSGGLMIETTDAMLPGDRVMVETLGLDACPARVAWFREGAAGLAFEAPQNIDALCRRGVDARGQVMRAPRFRSDRLACLRLAAYDTTVEIVNISAGGARLHGAGGIQGDVPGCLVLGAPLSPIAGWTRWAAGEDVGFRFAAALDRRALLTLIG